MGKLYLIVLAVFFLGLTHTADAQSKKEKDKSKEEDKEMEGFTPDNKVFTNLITFNTKGATKQEIDNFKRFFNIRNEVDSLRQRLGKQILVDERINEAYNVVYFSLEYLFVSQRYDNCGPILDMVEVYVDYLEKQMLAIEEED